MCIITNVIIRESLLQIGEASLRAIRLTCKHWRQAIDEQGTYWLACSADLRLMSLGPLPRHCHCQHLSLTFSGSPISQVLEYSPELITSFIESLRRINLDSPPSASGPRSLSLVFHNLVTRSSSIEAMLDEAAPKWRNFWPEIRLATSSVYNLSPGKDLGSGIIIDGGLRSELISAEISIKLERQVTLARLHLESDREICPFERWTQALKIPSRSRAIPMYYSLPEDMRLVHPKESIYPNLQCLSLPVRGTSIALMLNTDEPWASSQREGSIERLISNLMPNMKKLSFVGTGGIEGVGWSVGSFLRPEKVLFSSLPSSIEEICFFNAEMPRVHHSCSHLKPWEAVLLVSPAGYLMDHFVRPALAERKDDKSKLQRVVCIDLRVPSGYLLIEECVKSINFFEEDHQGEASSVLHKSLWSVKVSNRVFLLTAQDGFDVDSCTVTMTRL